MKSVLCRFACAYLEPCVYDQLDLIQVFFDYFMLIDSALWFPFVCRFVDSVLTLYFFIIVTLVVSLFLLFIYSFQIKMQNCMNCSNMFIDDFRFNLISCKLVLFLYLFNNFGVISLIFMFIIFNCLFYHLNICVAVTLYIFILWNYASCLV